MSDRRRFIKSSLFILGGCVLLPAHAFNKTGKKTIGIQLYTVRNAINENLEDTLHEVAKIGYNSLELAGYRNGNFYDKSPWEFNKIVNNLGMEVNSCHVLHELTREKGTCKIMDKWKKSVEDAKNVGSKYMVFPYFHPRYRNELDNYKLLAQNLNSIGEICKQNELQLAYHNHDYEFIELEGEIPYHLLMERTDFEGVKMELDLYWIIKAGKSPLEYFKKYPGRFSLWHVKDMEDSPEKYFAEVGKGSIDFAPIFAKSELAGMEYFFVEQDYSRRDPMESIKMSYNYLSNSNFL